MPSTPRYLGTVFNNSAENWHIHDIFCGHNVRCIPILVFTAEMKFQQAHTGCRACTCGVGRVTSSLKVKSSPDVTYAYSRHLLWDMAETTTTQLIFSVPAVPIFFRNHMALNKFLTYLRSKLATRLAVGNFPQVNNGLNSTRRTSRHQPSAYERPWIDEEEVLTELEPVRTRDGGETSLGPEQFCGGILRTTEIAITTTEDSNSESKSVRKVKAQRSWLEC